MKGLHVSVYRSAHFGDCSNNGISANQSSLTLVGAKVPGIFEASDRHPAIYLYRRRAYGASNSREGRQYLIAAPVEPIWSASDEENSDMLRALGYMFGGNFIYTSDSRFPGVGPIPIHDRQEN